MENREVHVIPQTAEPVIKAGWLRAVLFTIASVVGLVLWSLLALAVVFVLFDLSIDKIVSDADSTLSQLPVTSKLIFGFFMMTGQLLVTWLFRRFIDRKDMRSLGFTWKNYSMDFVSGGFWGFLLIFSGFLVLYLSGILTIKELNWDGASFFVFLLFFFFTAVNEEVMVRGYVLTNLMDSMGRYQALVVSALIFSLLHSANANFALIPAINIFLAGIILGIYYIHVRNLWFPIGMHFTWNFFQGPVFGFEVSGTESNGLIVHELNGHRVITGGEFGLEGSVLITLAILVGIVVLDRMYRKRTVAN